MLKLIVRELGKDRLSISIITLSLIVYFLIILNFSHIEDRIHSVMVEREFKSVESFASSIIEVMSRHINFPESEKLEEFTLKNYRQITEILETLNLKNVEYVFILKKLDSRFFILVDASEKDRLPPLTPIQLLPEEELVINRASQTKTSQILTHENIETIGITLYKPILKDGNVWGTLVLDFSVEKLREIEHLLSVIKYSIIALIGISILSLNLIVVSTIMAVYHHRRSIIDNLTKVYNRNFLESLKSFLDLSNYVVVLLDVDFFKKINDTYGHDAGDRVLKEIAKILKDNIRKEDILIRYGGEEFLLFIKKDRNSHTETLNAIERLRSLVESHKIYISKSDYLRATISAGINLSTDKMKDIDEAIKKADVALYRAKSRGRNRIEIYDETVSTQQSLMKVSKIKQALEEKKLICVYQPIVKLSTGKITHFEALVRIVDEDGSLISPNNFISAIENTFLYTQLTKEMIEYNLNILRKYPDLTISINLKPADILNQSTVDYLLSILTEELKGRIMVEIVETEDILTYERVLEVVQELRNVGYKICVDDFGSGYSNFVYLLKLKVDYLKIDANLIRNIHQDPISREVVKMINNFCRKMKIKVIAEYVENKEIFSTLKSLGLEYGQGYFFSKPQPIENFKK